MAQQDSKSHYVERVELKFWGCAAGADESIRTELHAHDYWQTEWSVYGDCVVRFADSELTLGPGDMVFVPPKVAHALVYRSKCHLYSFKFVAQLPEFRAPVRIAANPISEGIIRAAGALLDCCCPEEKKKLITGVLVMPGDHYQTLLEHLIAGVLEVYLAERAAGTGLAADLRRLVWEENGRPLSVATAARKIGYSRNHFSELVRKSTGIGAKELIDRERLEIAKRFLEYSKMNVSEVAEHLGFRSLFYFCNFFKRLTGQSPGQYQKQLTYGKQN